MMHEQEVVGQVCIIMQIPRLLSSETFIACRCIIIQTPRLFALCLITHYIHHMLRSDAMLCTYDIKVVIFDVT